MVALQQTQPRGRPRGRTVGRGISLAINRVASACRAGGMGTNSLRRGKQAACWKLTLLRLLGSQRGFWQELKGTERQKAMAGRVSLKDGVSKICLSKAGDVFLSRSVQGGHCGSAGAFAGAAGRLPSALAEWLLLLRPREPMYGLFLSPGSLGQPGTCPSSPQAAASCCQLAKPWTSCRQACPGYWGLPGLFHYIPHDLKN